MINKLLSFLVNYPKWVLFFITCLTLISAVFVPRLDIDASSESLMLNDDKDLNFARKMAKRFQTSDVLVVTYSPNSPLLSDKSIKTLKTLVHELTQVPNISGSLSILNAPLLQSPKLPIEELVKALPTLESNTTDKLLAKKEFLSSPLYKNNLVSANFKTTAIMLNLKHDKKYQQLLSTRNTLLKEASSPTQREKLQKVQKEFKTYREKVRKSDHENIEKIRSILKSHQNEAKLFLGGVSMISDDMITYVKSDVVLYGTSLLLLLIISLGVIFRQVRWVFIPIVICIYSVILTTGLFGFLGFEVTVISSNFISLQLIITLSIALHLIVQFQEYNRKFKHARQKRLVFTTILSKIKPSFFAIITTMAGFGSLIFSGIKPIINLGFMMGIGISISLITGFTLFASITTLLKKHPPKPPLSLKYSLTSICANLVLTRGKAIVVVSAIMLLVGIFGSTKLNVENSFINYFKHSTEIYKGMKVVDQELGGTTPLDVIITFKEEVSEGGEDDEFGDFEDEFNEEGKDAKYWFSRPKIQIIKKVSEYLGSLPEIGVVQSLDTMLQIGKVLNDGKELDSFGLAFLYNQMPKKYKDMVLEPFVDIEHNQVRFTTRVMDSNPDLKRDAFLKKVKKDLSKIVPQDTAEVKLSSFMVLYNNMLQSLYKSQIVTIGFVILVLMFMFWILFRSFKVAVIAIVSNLVPMSLVFGFMGLVGLPLDMMSITIAAISIGIGVDDTIHYIHRFKHEYIHTKDYEKAMITSHKTIGYAMYYTSFTIVLGFSILVISNFIPTIYFGLLTVCVMVLVLLGALLLLPKLLLSYKPF